MRPVSKTDVNVSLITNQEPHIHYHGRELCVGEGFGALGVDHVDWLRFWRKRKGENIRRQNGERKMEEK